MSQLVVFWLVGFNWLANLARNYPSTHAFLSELHIRRAVEREFVRMSQRAEQPAGVREPYRLQPAMSGRRERVVRIGQLPARLDRRFHRLRGRSAFVIPH